MTLSSGETSVGARRAGPVTMAGVVFALVLCGSGCVGDLSGPGDGDVRRDGVEPRATDVPGDDSAPTNALDPNLWLEAVASRLAAQGLSVPQNVNDQVYFGCSGAQNSQFVLFGECHDGVVRRVATNDEAALLLIVPVEKTLGHLVPNTDGGAAALRAVLTVVIEGGAPAGTDTTFSYASLGGIAQSYYSGFGGITGGQIVLVGDVNVHGTTDSGGCTGGFDSIGSSLCALDVTPGTTVGVEGAMVADLVELLDGSFDGPESMFLKATVAATDGTLSGIPGVSGAELRSVSVELSAAPEDGVYVNVGGELQATIGGDSLTFDISAGAPLSTSATTVNLGASLTGAWASPFGLSGMTLTDAGLVGWTDGSTGGASVSGSLNLGGGTEVGTTFSMTSSDVQASAYVQSLTRSQIESLLGKFGQGSLTLPRGLTAIERAGLTVDMTTVGTVTGFELDGVFLLDISGGLTVHGNIAWNGSSWSGSLDIESNIEVGGVDITGASISIANGQFVIQGSVDVNGTSVGVEVSMASGRVELDVQATNLPLGRLKGLVSKFAGDRGFDHGSAESPDDNLMVTELDFLLAIEEEDVDVSIFGEVSGVLPNNQAQKADFLLAAEYQPNTRGNKFVFLTAFGFSNLQLGHLFSGSPALALTCGYVSIANEPHTEFDSMVMNLFRDRVGAGCDVSFDEGGHFAAKAQLSNVAAHSNKLFSNAEVRFGGDLDLFASTPSMDVFAELDLVQHNSPHFVSEALKVFLRRNGSVVDVGFEGDVTVRIHDENVDFFLAADAGTNGFELRGGMNGTWRDPFGVQGLTLSDAEIAFSVDAAADIGLEIQAEWNTGSGPRFFLVGGSINADLLPTSFVLKTNVAADSSELLQGLRLGNASIPLPDLEVGPRNPAQCTGLSSDDASCFVIDIHPGTLEGALDGKASLSFQGQELLGLDISASVGSSRVSFSSVLTYFDTEIDSSFELDETGFSTTVGARIGLPWRFGEIDISADLYIHADEVRGDFDAEYVHGRHHYHLVAGSLRVGRQQFEACIRVPFLGTQCAGVSGPSSNLVADASVRGPEADAYAVAPLLASSSTSLLLGESGDETSNAAIVGRPFLPETTSAPEPGFRYLTRNDLLAEYGSLPSEGPRDAIVEHVRFKRATSGGWPRLGAIDRLSMSPENWENTPERYEVSMSASSSSNGYELFDIELDAGLDDVRIISRLGTYLNVKDGVLTASPPANDQAARFKLAPIGNGFSFEFERPDGSCLVEIANRLEVRANATCSAFVIQQLTESGADEALPVHSLPRRFAEQHHRVALYDVTTGRYLKRSGFGFVSAASDAVPTSTAREMHFDLIRVGEDRYAIATTDGRFLGQQREFDKDFVTENEKWTVDVVLCANCEPGSSGVPLFKLRTGGGGSPGLTVPDSTNGQVTLTASPSILMALDISELPLAPGRPVMETIAQTFVLQFSEAAFVVTGLASELRNDGSPFTLFVTWDYEWERMRWTRSNPNGGEYELDLDMLKTLPWRGYLRKLFQGLVYEGDLPSSAMVHGMQLPMLDGTVRNITFASNRMRTDGHRNIGEFVGPDGVLHLFQDVFDPSPDFRARTAEETVLSTNHGTAVFDSMFAEAVAWYAQWAPTNSPLRGDEITVFAPSDAALAGLNFGACSAAQRRGFVRRHVALGVVSYSFGSGTHDTAQPTVTIEWDPIAKTAKSNLSSYEVNADPALEEFAINGVAHVIDAPLYSIGCASQ